MPVVEVVLISFMLLLKILIFKFSLEVVPLMLNPDTLVAEPLRFINLLLKIFALREPPLITIPLAQVLALAIEPISLFSTVTLLILFISKPVKSEAAALPPSPISFVFFITKSSVENALTIYPFPPRLRIVKFCVVPPSVLEPSIVKFLNPAIVTAASAALVEVQVNVTVLLASGRKIML